jgi:molybdopterin converting factor small subunit
MQELDLHVVRLPQHAQAWLPGAHVGLEALAALAAQPPDRYLLAGELEVGLRTAAGAVDRQPGAAAGGLARAVEQHEQVVGPLAARAGKAAQRGEAHGLRIGRPQRVAEARYPLPMHVSVLLFGSLREVTGAKELDVALPEGATVADLSALLARDHPVFAQLPGRVRVSVNYEVVAAAQVLRDGDEVA